MDGQKKNLMNGEFRDSPVNRFFAPYSLDVVLDWLPDKVPAGGWILDPFCSNPRLIMDLAREGYKVISCCNNPIVKIILQAEAQGFSKKRVKEIFEKFGSENRGSQTLREYVQSLYRATCPICHTVTVVSRYIWDREPLSVRRKILFCPKCNVLREVDAEPEDQSLIHGLDEQPLPAKWALNRLGLPPGTSELNVKTTLDLYSPRALNILFTLINRIEALQTDEKEKNILRAIILFACDGGTGFWQENGATPSLKQIIKPSTFIEYNIWLVMEQALHNWVELETPVPVVEYPEALQRSGICVYSGKARKLFPIREEVRIKCLAFQLPKMNPVFFSLSGLWTGWIFGKEKSSLLQGVFQPRDYDWQWQASALMPTFRVLSQNLSGLPCLVLETETTNGSVLADAIAAQGAGWKMDWIQSRGDHRGFWFDFTKLGIEPIGNWQDLRPELIELFAGRTQQSGGSISYDELFVLMLCHLSRSSDLCSQKDSIPLNLLPNMQAFLNDILANSDRFEVVDLSAPLTERRWRPKG